VFEVWQLLNVFGCFLLLAVVVEEFVVRVFTGGKVTVSRRLRELFSIEGGDYIRLVLVEVMKKGDNGWCSQLSPAN
jgi:hypothetical protein